MILLVLIYSFGLLDSHQGRAPIKEIPPVLLEKIVCFAFAGILVGNCKFGFSCPKSIATISLPTCFKRINYFGGCPLFRVGGRGAYWGDIFVGS